MLDEQGGELVAVLRGANAPLLQRLIVEELTKEKLVLEQGGERRAVRHTNSPTVIHLLIQYFNSRGETMDTIMMALFYLSVVRCFELTVSQHA